LSLCERFPNMNPFYVREQRFVDVMSIIRRLNNYQVEKPKIEKQRNRIPAGDEWF